MELILVLNASCHVLCHAGEVDLWLKSVSVSNTGYCRVAQLDRVLDYESSGYRFDSYLGHKTKALTSKE